MRQIILDTETTGLSPQQGHRIIEIGCVELINRRVTGKHFHYYLQPDRPIDAGAVQVHGITEEFLIGKPRFHEVAQEFKNFIKGAELIIHNAPFDVGFLEYEFLLLNEKEWLTLSNHCPITDTLLLARQKHPGQRNNLDALCKRYNIDNTHRDKHGALLDAHILADVYLAMTGGQEVLILDEVIPQAATQQISVQEAHQAMQFSLPIIQANAEELTAHESLIHEMKQKYGAESHWQELAVTNETE